MEPLHEVPAPVLDEALIEDIGTWIQRYVVLPSEDHALVLSTWIIHTWLFEAASVTPYIYIHSREPASGKTRLLEVLGVLARNARRADDMTPSVCFKLIERERPTLLADEIDTVWAGSRNDAKRQIYCTGYRVGGCAWREQARELIQFSTFSAKVLCGLDNGFMPETVKSRCIEVKMTRKTKGQECEKFVEARVVGSPEVEGLLDRIMAFRENFFVDVVAQRPALNAAMSDRQDEISEPLLAIANVFGIESEVRGALQRIFELTTGQSSNPQKIILERIRQAFGDAQKMFTADLCAALGPAYNGRQLAIWLQDFAIRPRDIRQGNKILKGYKRSDFEHVWGVYLNVPEPIEQESEVAV